MGRPRAFDTDDVVRRAGEVFARSGYHGASVDEVLKATGIQRASLYQAFGSKRGLFVEVLRRGDSADVLLVALMDLAADDEEIRTIAERMLRAQPGDPATALGAQLLTRAGLIGITEMREDA